MTEYPKPIESIEKMPKEDEIKIETLKAELKDKEEIIIKLVSEHKKNIIGLALSGVLFLMILGICGHFDKISLDKEMTYYKSVYDYQKELYNSKNLSEVCHLSFYKGELNGWCTQFNNETKQKSSLYLFHKEEFVCGKVYRPARLTTLFRLKGDYLYNYLNSVEKVIGVKRWYVNLNNCIKNDNGVLTWK
jgi:hypothetical protein